MMVQIKKRNKGKGFKRYNRKNLSCPEEKLELEIPSFADQ